MYRYAVIIADPNSMELGNIKSRHHTLPRAEGSIMELRGTVAERWAYIARRKMEGSWQHRVEAQQEN